MVVHRHNLATSRSKPTWTHDNPVIARTLERLACHPERYCSAGSRSKTVDTVLGWSGTEKCYLDVFIDEMSQTFTVSSPPVTIRFPSGLKLTL